MSKFDEITLAQSYIIDKIHEISNESEATKTVESSSISHVNMKRSLLIEEAKEYYENNKQKVKRIKVSREHQAAFVEYLVEGVTVKNTVHYPSGLV